jgi:hypothetical protein
VVQPIQQQAVAAPAPDAQVANVPVHTQTPDAQAVAPAAQPAATEPVAAAGQPSGQTQQGKTRRVDIAVVPGEEVVIHMVPVDGSVPR